MDADAKLDAALGRHAGVPFDHRVLNFHRAAHGVDDAAELDESAVAGALDDAAVMYGPLCNGWEEALHFFPQVRDGIAIAREMPQQASLEKSIKQRIEGAPGDERLSATK